MARHWLGPGECREVVQIGSVRLDETFRVAAEFDVLVGPRVNGHLSAYFESLTGITNAALAARGIDFAEAYRRFLDFCGQTPIAAFGHDEDVLAENIRLYGLADMAPLPPFHDLRAWFARHQVDPRGLHSCDIGPALGVPFAGHAHNALDDARSIAAGMRVMAARGAALPLAA